MFLCQDKKYASDKYKDIYTELSIVKAKADCDISRLKEQLKAATEAQGEKSPVNTTVSGYGQCSSSRSKPSLGSWFSTCIPVYEPLCSTWAERRALRGAFFAISCCIPPLLLVETSLGAARSGQPELPPPPQLFILPGPGGEAGGPESPSATSLQESLVLRAPCPGLACRDAEKPPLLVGCTPLMLSFCFSPDIMKSKSNPDFLKKDRSSVSRQLRNIRSKVSSQLFPCDAGGQHYSLVGI